MAIIVIILGSNAHLMVWIAVPESAQNGNVSDGVSFPRCCSGNVDDLMFVGLI